MKLRRSASLITLSVPAALLLSISCAIAQVAPSPVPPLRHNVIIFVADGLRRGSVNATDTPALYRLRTQGTDLRNSHSVFPTVTTANASVIATGHGLGDTGDFGNVLYPGVYLTDPNAPATSDGITPFLENDDVLASMNAGFHGNYLSSPTLLGAAQEHGYNVASIGKLGPTAIQLIASVHRNELGQIDLPAALIIDDATGHDESIPLPPAFAESLAKSGLPAEAPQRNNGYAATSQYANSFVGSAVAAGTLAPNLIQQQWFADVATRLVLPQFAEDYKTSGKPFAMLFWSRDPDGTQHDEGDSLQSLTPGINGPTVSLALRNADHCLQQLLDFLEEHPALKATTDILVTSDHGFATISRRELDAEGTLIATPAAALTYKTTGKEKPEPASTVPPGFLGIDLALYLHQRLFDPTLRATTGDSVYAEVQLSGETASYPPAGAALLGQKINRLDGSDARLILAPNGGSEYLYVPERDRTAAAAIVMETVSALTELDYVGGIFVDDAFCPTATACPGALPMSAVGLEGAAALPQPTIVVSYKHFYLHPGDMQSGIQIMDTSLQEGQGNHGGLARDQTWNNMAAIGPDFKAGYVDNDPVGNIDIAPTLAYILGVSLPATGKLAGRVMTESLVSSTAAPKAEMATLVSAPAANGRRTVLHYQQAEGVRYYDRACLIGSKPAVLAKAVAGIVCPE